MSEVDPLVMQSTKTIINTSISTIPKPARPPSKHPAPRVLDKKKSSKKVVKTDKEAKNDVSTNGPQNGSLTADPSVAAGSSSLDTMAESAWAISAEPTPNSSSIWEGVTSWSSRLRVLVRLRAAVGAPLPPRRSVSQRVQDDTRRSSEISDGDGRSSTESSAKRRSSLFSLKNRADIGWVEEDASAPPDAGPADEGVSETTKRANRRRSSVVSARASGLARISSADDAPAEPPRQEAVAWLANDSNLVSHMQFGTSGPTPDMHKAAVLLQARVRGSVVRRRQSLETLRDASPEHGKGGIGSRLSTTSATTQGSEASWSGRVLQIQLLQLDAGHSGFPKDREVGKALKLKGPGTSASGFTRRIGLKLSQSAALTDIELNQALHTHLSVAADDILVVYYKPKSFTTGAWPMANLHKEGSEVYDELMDVAPEDELRLCGPVLVFQRQKAPEDEPEKKK